MLPMIFNRIGIVVLVGGSNLNNLAPASIETSFYCLCRRFLKKVSLIGMGLVLIVVEKGVWKKDDSGSTGSS